jgi:predicted O-methyltransferase YrrM
MKIQLGSIKVPFYSNIFNFGFESFTKIKNQIDEISGYKEIEKVNILSNDYFYIQYFTKLFNVKIEDVLIYFNDYKNDDKFHSEFSKKLNDLELIDDGNAGDVRFNSLLLYTTVRILKPKILMETGVANGKSSALFLLAMKHNGFGNLISIDLPNNKNNILDDGAMTHTFGKEVGWLVPDYLNINWKLILNNSIDEMEKYFKEKNKIDLFFHDSLHTFDHTYKELTLAFENMNSGGCIMVDDIDMDSGKALYDIMTKYKKIGFAYREIGSFIK